MDYVCGDIHGDHDIRKLNSDNFPEGKLMTKKDVMLQVGDFGLLWANKRTDDEEHWLNWLSRKPWTTVFIDGNHENFVRLNALPQVEMFGGMVGMVEEDIFHLRRGNVYTFNDKKIFVMGGGLSIDRGRRTPYVSWWPEEIPNYAEWKTAEHNLEANNWEVDYVVTHDIHEAGYEALFDEDQHYYKESYELPKNLEFIRKKLKYKHWYCGHHHQDRVFDQFKTTILFDVVRPLGE